MNDFSKSTLRSLAAKGISLVGITLLPDNGSAMPFANGERGYLLNDNGCGIVRTFGQVLELAK
jgi:hypothetical protein